MAQNIDFSSSDQIQTPQYPDVHPPSPEISNEVFHAKEDLIISIQTFLEEFNYIPFGEKPKNLFQAWDKFFTIQRAQPEDSNKLFKKLLEDLKELTEYNRPIFSDNNENHSEVKNVVEQPVERGNRIIQSLQNFRVIRKSSTFLKDTSQISPVHAITPILSTEEPKHSLSMGYEHLSTTPEIKSNKVTSEDDSKCDMPAKDDFSPTFTIFSNPLFNDNDDLDSSDDESLPDDDEFSGALAHINPVLPRIKKADLDFEEEIRLIENLLYDNSSPRPPEELNAEIADTIIESLPSLPIPVQDGDSQREEIDIVTETDDVLPPSVENDDDSEGEINVVEELLRDNSISLTEDESSDSDHQDDLTFPRPPPEPPDAEIDAEEEILVVINEFDDKNNDYCSFMFVIQNFLLYLICFKMFLSFLSAESEDTIFDPGISI
uniref:Reverse transcriptase domain-containing protein n=1 Tax=Tanacetum cinerariifolium TaxID=118510 RepID=A0A699IBL4_TANCI|nr:hypothetical protein [Tanacetum cinerariifolium]